MMNQALRPHASRAPLIINMRLPRSSPIQTAWMTVALVLALSACAEPPRQSTSSSASTASSRRYDGHDGYEEPIFPPSTRYDIQPNRRAVQQPAQAVSTDQCLALDTAVARMRTAEARQAGKTAPRSLSLDRTEVLARALAQTLTGQAQASQMLLVDQADGSVSLRIPGPVLLTGPRQISRQFLDIAQRIAQAIGRYCHVTAHVVGHTEQGGNEGYNRSLSTARALRVAELISEALARQGVRDRRLSYEGMGTRQPVANSATSQGRVLNNRVEVIVRLAAAERNRS